MATGHQASVEAIRRSIRDVCRKYPSAYWRELDRERAYPTAFVDELTELGWLSALIPTEFGGAGLSLTEASVILEEVNRSGGNASACHGQMYTMGILLRHGSGALKERYLPRIASGELRLQAFGVTEPDAGSETTRITTTAVRDGDSYRINGQKVFISRVMQSDLMVVAGPHDAVRRAGRQDTWALRLRRRSCRAGLSDQHPATQAHDQPARERPLLR